MSPPASVRLSITVAVDPDTAFDVFTGEIDAWYRRGPHTFVDNRETEVDVRFESDGDGATRVTLEHRGRERLPPDEAVQHAKYGGQLLLKWYRAHMRARPTARKEST